MNAPRFRPYRRLRGEIVPFLAVIALAFAILSLFPRDVLRFVRAPRAADAPSVPAPTVPAPAGCSFVTLSRAQEDAALAAARTSWQAQTAVRGHHPIEMLPAELPASAPVSAVESPDRPTARVEFRACPLVTLLPPTAAASAPVRLPRAARTEPVLPFPRELMLRID